ncbi:unnamed protein product, partial [Cladocopium goreaui]
VESSWPSYVKQIIFWIFCGFGFSAFVFVNAVGSAAASWSYGYFLEYMLSVDNLFVFQLVFKAYATPEGLHIERALFWGISAAILLRLAFFGLGTSLLAMGFFAKLAFGLLLIYSGIKAFWDDDDEADPSKNLLVRCVARHLPLHDKYSEEPRFFVRVKVEGLESAAEPAREGAKIIGKSKDEVELHGMMDVDDPQHPAASSLKVTPLFLVVLTLAFIDVIFAVDSVTAKVSSVHGFDPRVSFFLNLSSSAFAMFVLRSLYLVVDMLTQSFRFLKYGVGIVLVFIGIKLIISGWYEVSMTLSSLLIVGFLLCSIVASCLPCCKEEDVEDVELDEAQPQEVDGEVFVIEDLEEPTSCTYQWTECAQFCLSWPQKEFEAVFGAARCLETIILPEGERNSEEDRTQLLASMMQGTTAILASKMGLQDHGCYHELCRLLGKINATHQLNELCANEQFQAWIEQVYGFTMDSLRRWEVMPNSKHYLLGFWAAMVSPVILLQEKAPKALESFIQQVTVAYVESRLFMAEASADPNATNDWDDPLEDEVLRAEQLEVLSNLGRCRYQDTAQHIMKHFEETSRLGQQNLIPQQVFEKKMTWLVYMMGALVGGHASAKANRTDTDCAPTHVVNGELAGRIFRLVNLTVQQKQTCEGLEIAYLYFLEQFRKLYIGEHAKQVVQQQVNERLATVLGLEDENAVLGLLINKIGNNLQQRYQIESVVKKTLALFHELAAGINIVHTSDRSPHLIVCGRLLLKNEMVKYILSNHASPEFGFLTYSLQYGKYRTMYYHTLGKLLFMDIRDNKEAFEKFMEPQGLILTQLWQQSCQNPQLLRQDHVKPALIGLCRDLRGIGLACTSCEPYSMLFDWLVDNPKNPSINRVNLFSRALDAWWDDPEVTTPLLKFMAEFVHNKAQRITFDQSSPNGILLFREASAILVTYGTRILQRTQFRDVYVEKYKGIGVCSGPQLGSTLRLFTKIWGISPTQFGYRMGMNGMDNHYSYWVCLKMGVISCYIPNSHGYCGRE